MLNLVDAIIIIFLLFAGVIGASRGVFKELVLCIGTIIVFYLAYMLKNPVGNFLLLRLPMFDFPNLFKGVVTLNILVYQTLSFLLVLALLLVIFSVILTITGLFEKLLKITIILGIPSKILGFLVGLVEGYIILFVILFFLTQPAFSFNSFINSKFANKILTSSPVLSGVTEDTVDLFEEIYALKDEKDTNELNRKTLNMMITKNVVECETVNELYSSGKMKFEGIEDIISNCEN